MRMNLPITVLDSGKDTSYFEGVYDYQESHRVIHLLLGFLIVHIINN